MFTRRQFLLSSGAILVAAAAPRVQAQGDPSLKFLVVGDWGKSELADNARRVARQMAIIGASPHTDFVISTGDNFYEGGVSSVDDPAWQTAFELMYADPALQCPWYPVLGNHDYRGNSQAEIEYSATSTRWTMPSRYYKISKTLENGDIADFFFIDTEPFVQAQWWNQAFGAGADANMQLAWLDRELASSRARWKFVTGHHPVYAGGSHGSTPALVERIEPLLRQHRVQAYFNGHNHDLQHIEVAGVHYFNSGAGAEAKVTNAIAGTLFAEGRLGFLSAVLNPENLDIEFISDAGTVLYGASISR